MSDAKPDIRRHAIGFLGRVLNGEEPLPDDVVSRFLALWEVYWAQQGKTDAGEKPDASLFGAWFSCGKFPEQWSLERLDEYTTVVPLPDSDHGVAKQLAKIVETDPQRTTRILGRMVRNDHEGWHLSGWLDSTKQILQTGMAAGGDARKEAEAIIDYLGRRGYTDLGDLLDTGI